MFSDVYAADGKYGRPDENGDAKDAELFDIESDEEWDMVEGVLDTFLNDENMR